MGAGITQVGIATGHGLNGRGSIPGRGKRFYFLLYSVQTAMCTGPFFPVVKLPGREADLLAVSSAEVKNAGSIPPLPHAHIVVLS
jgi:hypothetical protein